MVSCAAAVICGGQNGYRHVKGGLGVIQGCGDSEELSPVPKSHLVFFSSASISLHRFVSNITMSIKRYFNIINKV